MLSCHHIKQFIETIWFRPFLHKDTVISKWTVRGYHGVRLVVVLSNGDIDCGRHYLTVGCRQVEEIGLSIGQLNETLTGNREGRELSQLRARQGNK